MKVNNLLKTIMLFFISILLIVACGGGKTGESPKNPSIETSLLGKSLVYTNKDGSLSYLYLREDHKFYGYGYTKEVGYFAYGYVNNGSWHVENKTLKMDFNDNDLWTLSVDLDQMEAIITHNFANENIGLVRKINATPAKLIERVNNDDYNSKIEITEKELVSKYGWIIINRTNPHSITASYSKDGKVYRSIGDTIHDLGFVNGDRWSLSQDGKKILHSRVTHELVRKEDNCYITRSTMSGDKSWVKEYKMCGYSPTENKTMFERSEVEGNTVEYNDTASFTLKPMLKPLHNVTIDLSSTDTTQGSVEPKQLVFTPSNWDVPQTVTLRGQNKTPVDDKQNYQIMLSAAQSQDSRYEGVDLKDIDIKGIELSISAPKNLKPVFAGIDNKIYLDTKYNGGKSRYYQITTDIANMSIEPFSGVINYRSDGSLEGASVDVYISMTDGRQKTETHFKLDIAKTTPAETEMRGDSLVIIDNGNDIAISNEDGLSASLSVAKVKESDLPDIPEGVVRLSDFYIIKGDISVLDQ